MRAPFCVGVKVTRTVQVAPAANVLPQSVFGGPALRAKSPEVAMLVMLSVAVPVFLT